MKTSIIPQLITGILVALGVCACSTFKVSKVTGNEPGDRYTLPKPFLVVAPKSDGTIAVDVVYLPDNSHKYAIETSSYMSAYTFQVSRDQNGALTQLEYKKSTVPVGAQLAASAGAGLAQLINLRSAEANAVQTQVTTAQTTVDQAAASVAADQATLNAHQTSAANAAQTNIGPSQLAIDAATLAADQAKLQAAQTALARVKATPQALASPAAAAGTVNSISGPTISTVIGAPTWSDATPYNLPEQYGAVYYRIDENDCAPILTPVAIPGDTADNEVAGAEAQKKYATASFGILFPNLIAPAGSFAKTVSRTAVIRFDQKLPGTDQPDLAIKSNTNPDSQIKVLPQPTGDRQGVSIDLTELPPGSYTLEVNLTYPSDNNGGTRTEAWSIPFTVDPVAIPTLMPPSAPVSKAEKAAAVFTLVQTTDKSTVPFPLSDASSVTFELQSTANGSPRQSATRFCALQPDRSTILVNTSLLEVGTYFLYLTLPPLYNHAVYSGAESPLTVLSAKFVIQP